jgi:hypothetical protein
LGVFPVSSSNINANTVIVSILRFLRDTNQSIKWKLVRKQFYAHKTCLGDKTIIIIYIPVFSYKMLTQQINMHDEQVLYPFLYLSALRQTALATWICAATSPPPGRMKFCSAGSWLEYSSNHVSKRQFRVTIREL